jgi:hypothetical protein
MAMTGRVAEKISACAMPLKAASPDAAAIDAINSLCMAAVP